MIDYMVMEAIAIKVTQEDAKAEKEARKKAEWEKNAKESLDKLR